MVASPNHKPAARLKPPPIKVETPRAAETVAATLEEMILQGVLRPGERLASERDLAARLGVSRPTLRDALSQLAERGLLSLSREGARVAEYLAPLAGPLVELFSGDARVAADYFEFRATLEAEAARLAAQRATPMERAALGDLLAKMRKAHRLEDPQEESALDVSLHLAIYEAAHNLVMLHVMRVLSQLLRDDVFYSRDRLYRRAGARDLLLAQHVAIIEAILASDPTAARKAAAAHIAFVFEAVEAQRRDDERLNTALRRLNRADLVSEPSS